VRFVGVCAFAAFLAVIVLANWAVQTYGRVGVGFGLVAPAGVYFAGLAFTLRDILHRTLGRAVVIVAIVAGAAVSYWISDAVTITGGIVTLAVASGVAFLVGELADLAVYEPIRRRGWAPAVVASNIAGLFVDSLLFLSLAFGSLAFLWGQIVGKAWMTALAVTLLALWNARKPVPA
jgi:uncharacterized PurR-regulated membrane protein YhhQ (DUF165 family)